MVKNTWYLRIYFKSKAIKMLILLSVKAVSTSGPTSPLIPRVPGGPIGPGAPLYPSFPEGPMGPGGPCFTHKELQLINDPYIMRLKTNVEVISIYPRSTWPDNSWSSLLTSCTLKNV